MPRETGRSPSAVAYLESHSWEHKTADALTERIDGFLENVYNLALVKSTLAYRASLPPDQRDLE